MAETTDFIAVQRCFAAHLRDPAHALAPEGIEERRLAIYRELFFGNIAGTLKAAFPVLRQMLGDERFTVLARAFYAEHRSPYPQLHRLPEAFVDYLHEQRSPQADDPPYLGDLAHYEWVELALSIAEDVEVTPFDVDGDLLAAPPLLTPLCWILAYEYPVHRIGPGVEAVAAATYLAVYRNADDEVKFVELNALSARLLSLIEEQPQASGRALLRMIADELAHADAEALIAAGATLLDDLRARGLILGTRLG